MKVNDLGPCLLAAHPTLAGIDTKWLAPNCYLVEVSGEAGVDGPIIEGDLLVVDEACSVYHEWFRIREAVILDIATGVQRTFANQGI